MLNTIISTGKNPIVFLNGLYLADSPIQKQTIGMVTELRSDNVYWSVIGSANSTNAAIIRANTSMDSLMNYYGRGSITGLVLDGNNRVNNVINFSQPGEAMPRFPEIRYIKAMRANDRAIKLDNAEAINFYNSVFSDSQYGWKSNVSPSGTYYCWNCYFQNNSVSDIDVVADTDKGAAIFLYGGVSANEEKYLDYDSTFILRGSATMELYGYWIDNSTGANIKGVTFNGSNPSFTAFGGRFAVSSSGNQSNFVGNFSRMQQYGFTQFINSGTATTILNANSTTIDFNGYSTSKSIGTFVAGTSVLRWSFKDSTLANVISNVPLYATQKPSSPQSGAIWINTTGRYIQYFDATSPGAWNSVVMTNNTPTLANTTGSGSVVACIDAGGKIVRGVNTTSC